MRAAFHNKKEEENDRFTNICIKRAKPLSNVISSICFIAQTTDPILRSTKVWIELLKKQKPKINRQNETCKWKYSFCFESKEKF